MYDSLNIGFDENRSMYMPHVIDRHIRYPHNGVTVSYAR
jgi:hypothetical protein